MDIAVFFFHVYVFPSLVTKKYGGGPDINKKLFKESGGKGTKGKETKGKRSNASPSSPAETRREMRDNSKQGRPQGGSRGAFAPSFSKKLRICSAFE